MGTIIKRINEYDKDLITYLFNEAGMTVKSVNKQFFNDNKNILLVAYIKDKPVGFLYGNILESLNSNQPYMFLYSIDVFEKYQRLGIGQELIKELKVMSKEYNCREMFVLTNDSNMKAKGLYEKTGGIRENLDDVMFVYDINK